MVTNYADRDKLQFRDYLLMILPIFAFISLQFRVNNTLLNISLLLTFMVLATIFVFNIDYFNIKDIIVILLNATSILVTLLFFPGFGVSFNFINLLFCFLIFNKIPFSSRAINFAQFMIVLGILAFLISSSYSIQWDWVVFYDINGVLINNNTIAFILVALYIHLSSLMLKIKRKWSYIAVFALLVFCVLSINILGCRSALLFFIVYFILWLFKKEIFGKQLRKSCLIFLVVSFCLPLLYLFFYNQVGNFEIMGKGFFSGREQVWAQAYEQIKISPIFGTGTKYALEFSATATESTHNMLLGLLKNLGIIPLISLINYYMLADRPQLDKNVAISILAMISIACFESFLMDSRLYLLFLIVFPGTCRKQTKQSS